MPSSSLLRRVSRVNRGQRDKEVESWSRGIGQRLKQRETKQPTDTGFRLGAQRGREIVIDGSAPALGSRL